VCAGSIPVNRRVTCGFVTVPEDRSHPRGAKVRLAVAVVHSRSPHPRPDPIVYLAGGPGGSGLDAVTGFLSRETGGDRDVVLFDQRGTGASRPNLSCAEVKQSIWTILGTADPLRRIGIDADGALPSGQFFVDCPLVVGYNDEQPGG
jgi:pimeloyl-ACP methyl ester carboxylesterase